MQRTRGIVRLIHWNTSEGIEKAAVIRACGYDVTFEPFSPSTLKPLREFPPSAFVIDLSRLPSQGRDVATAIRSYKALRYVPLIFVDGDPRKVANIKNQIPDVVYTDWSEIGNSLKRAMFSAQVTPVVLRSRLEGYAGAPLTKKLGVKPGSVVALIGAPPGFERKLGDLSKSVVVERHSGGLPDLTIWFVRTREEMQRDIRSMTRFAQNGRLWIAWPKQSSDIPSDLTQTVVREIGLSVGIVDYKICAIDETWSGLKWTKRKSSQ